MFKDIMNKDVSKKKFLTTIGITALALPLLSQKAFGEYLFRNETNTYKLNELVNTMCYSAFGITIDAGTETISTGEKKRLTMPYACTITGWRIVGNTSGNIVIDVWKANGAIPTVANTITGTEKPTLSSQVLNSDLSLSTWTTSVAAGDVVIFNVDSCTGLSQVTLVIMTEK